MSKRIETMSTEFLYDVFLNHNSADKPRVRRPGGTAAGGGHNWCCFAH